MGGGGGGGVVAAIDPDSRFFKRARFIFVLSRISVRAL